MAIVVNDRERIGEEKLGVLFDGGKVRRRREWRGLRDTLYDYGRWLYILSMVISKEIAEEDTPENREQAYYDMAYLTENMIMRNRTHGGYKALTGMHGQFEEQARERGLHLVWVCHDLCDPRVYTRQAIRDQFNVYMRTVMREEPLDPTIEVLPDENAW